MKLFAVGQNIVLLISIDQGFGRSHANPTHLAGKVHTEKALQKT